MDRENSGEFELIARIRDVVGAGKAVVGIGDDAAVLALDAGRHILATVDMYVQDVHFRLGAEPLEEVGARAMAVNVSDIAAMGGIPESALVSLAIPTAVSIRDVEELYRGLHAAAARFGTSIVGGNITRTHGPLAIDVVVLGSVPAGERVLRSGALPGDLLAVTGTLGGAALARRRLTTALAHGDSPTPIPVPEPRIPAGRALAADHLVNAMMDLSDGLAGDLPHLCRASGVGARVNAAALPISPELSSAMSFREAVHLALTGGEDYELLCAVPPALVERASAAVAPLPLTVIGSVTAAEEGILLVAQDGTPEPLPGGAWRHF